MCNLRGRLVILGLAAGTLLPGAVSAWTPSPAMAPAASGDTLPYILSNDNRRPAGRLRDGVLTLRLEARNGMWYPEGPDGLARAVAAFAEEGGPLQNPGPLIRVPAGKEVRVIVRNLLGEALTMHGLGAQRGIAADSVRIEPGEAREMRFRAAAPGTYWYAGRTTPVARLFARRGQDSQLNGVIVVDPPGAPPRARDRIFLISWWGSGDATMAGEDSPELVRVINGLSWPHTERIDATQGDSLHWRWVSMTGPGHPMHLHGFYFRVQARGDGTQDTLYTADRPRLAVTETLLSGQTMAIAWSPDKPGNWLFHCHVVRHMTPHATLHRDRRMPTLVRAAHTGPHSARGEHMAGLVLGIRVRPREAPLARASAEPRAIRLLIRSQPNVYGGHVGYGYVLGGSPAEADRTTLPVPGPTLVLEKAQPVAITLVNQSHEPAAVHWHGIELESFPDGVPGWSGWRRDVLPAVSAGDSLTVRFTPPRAGTFMYHSHFNEHQQISSGLYGAIVVLEPGERFDPETDRVLLFSDAAPVINIERGPLTPALLNGRVQPEPMELRAGTTYRFRLINIRTDPAVAVALLDGDRPAEWRHVAKDGADLPAAQATLRPARLTLRPGEIYDFELTPRSPGELRLRFGYPEAVRPANLVVLEPVVVAVRVR
jgi:FtsP/CotA-like multicopper oxidase with cupredoxin domain